MPQPNEATRNPVEPVRLAVIGAGLMGRKHAGLIHAHDACSLVGICDVHPGCKAFADELSVPFYRDAVGLIEHEHPEGAIIATPNGLHSALAEICARRSVHTLIEKPIADALDEARRIVALEDDFGIQMLIGHHRRHNPLVQEARAIVNSGELGRLVAVSMLWTLYKPDDYYGVEWRCKRPGGGPTLINLIHEFDILRYVCGEIDRIYAQTSSAVRALDVEDTISATLSFANGAVGSLLASDTTPAPWSYEMTTGENPYYFHADENCYHILGTLGSLAFPQMARWRYADEGRMGWQHPLEASCVDVPPADPLVKQLEHFCRVVRRVEAPIVSPRDAAQTLAVSLAALESAESREPVEVMPV